MKNLMRHSYTCMSIHGGIDQYDRDSTMDDFKAGNIKLLVSCSVFIIIIIQGSYRPWKVVESPEIKMSRFPGLESPGKGVGPGNPGKVLEFWSSGPENFTFWFKYHSLDKKFIVIHCVHFVNTGIALGLFTVMQLHLKLIWYVQFLNSCNHVCERSVCWKVLENAFFESWKTLEFGLCKSWKVLEN